MAEKMIVFLAIGVIASDGKICLCNLGISGHLVGYNVLAILLFYNRRRMLSDLICINFDVMHFCTY